MICVHRIKLIILHKDRTVKTNIYLVWIENHQLALLIFKFIDIMCMIYYSMGLAGRHATWFSSKEELKPMNYFSFKIIYAKHQKR